MDRMLHPELMRELELRVTDGPQVGASAPLPPGAGCVIAAGGDRVAAGTVPAGAAARVMAHVAAAPAPDAAGGPPTLAVALRASPFATLDLVRDAEGRPRLRGRLATLAERSQLDAWLAEHQFSASVDV